MPKHHILSFYLSPSLLLLPSCLPFPFFLPLDQSKYLFQHFNHFCQTLKFVSPFLLHCTPVANQTFFPWHLHLVLERTHNEVEPCHPTFSDPLSAEPPSYLAVSPWVQLKALSYSLKGYFKPLLPTPPLLTGWKFLAFLIRHQQDFSIRLFINSKDSMFFIYVWG